MKSLPIPVANENTLVFFRKHMKLADSQTSVQLQGETHMATLVHRQMMSIFAQVAFKMGDNPDKKALNKEVNKLRAEWLAEQGVSCKGIIIFVGGKPCYRINVKKVGLRKGFFQALIEKIEATDTKRKLGIVKRSYNQLFMDYRKTCKGRYKDFFAEQSARVYSAYETQHATF
jgi:hypothetical protein